MRNRTLALGVLWVLGCGEAADTTVLFAPVAGGGPSPTDAGSSVQGEFSDGGALKGPPLQLPANLLRSDSDGLVLNAPSLLSETGVFWDLVGLEPNPQLLAYTVQQPLFTDGAVKSRWLALPEGEVIGYHGTEPWAFPVGTVLVKQFDLALDRRDPTTLTRLETRLLVAGEGGDYYGLTYAWNAEGTDAEVVLEATTLSLQVVDEQGDALEQDYLLPGPNDCLSCHLKQVGSVLGFRAAQLHSAQDLAALPDDQLFQFSAQGVFDQSLTDQEILELPSLAPLRDTTRTAEDRVRSYLDANCSNCHGGRSDLAPRFDARYTTALELQGLVGVPPVVQRRGPGYSVIAPGDVDKSEIYLRDSSTSGGEKMPPLGRSLVDEEYLAVLREWIESLRGDSRFD